MSDFLPLKLLTEVTSVYPNLNKLVNHTLSLRIQYWSAPENVFIPITVWAKILQQHGTPEITRSTSTLAALVAWRYSQGVYHFDEALLGALSTTDMDKPMPIEVLTRLPEYCIYIQIPDDFLQTMPGVVGTLVSYDFNYNTQLSELRFELCSDTETKGAVVVPLRDGATVHEEVEHTVAMVSDYLRHEGMPEKAGQIRPPAEYAKDVQKLVSLVLYLCSDKPEVDDLRQPGKSPSRPKPKKVKGGMALFPAQKVTVWEVGRSLGQALRNAATRKQEYAGGTHASPRAHVRRGHWHGYWTGPMKGDNRVFVLKWLHPMLVGMDK